MKVFIYIVSIYLVIFTGCSAPKIEPVKVSQTHKKIDYLKDVQPILNKRCVTCHSCYNSPCQAKLSSFEGVDRGASKIEVYNATRLRAIDPTRLFIDAHSTKEWRKKGFFSLTRNGDSNATHNDSIMMHLLYDKKNHPQIIGNYNPEHDELTCARDKKEIEEYIYENPNHGMPYGFPEISKSEYKTLSSWLLQGAKGLSKSEQKALQTPSKNAAIEIEKWENFLNKSDAKHKMTARYLYEHLYLAHIYFPNTEGEFYSLIRSYTPSGEESKTIPTIRPFDDPNVENFYYRLEKIQGTIVHKTHMVFKFDDTVLSRFKELFIKPKWVGKPFVQSYSPSISSNPFIAFKQIPVRSRYQFLLDNSLYTIMTFIRGPVCRGQMALNVIHDHFWVMFKDPSYDIGVLYPELLDNQVNNLSLPIQSVNQSVFKAFSDEYRNRYESYFKAKRKYIENKHKDRVGYDSIWKGEKPSDAPLLTIYRHFDSASVNKGVLGELPRTMWVIDYAQFERIYYSLVAGYDVFGNVSHQTNVRRYMDFLRIEGEINFLNYMPKGKRTDMLKSWYIGDNRDINSNIYLGFDTLENKIDYKTRYPMDEFIHNLVNHHILKSTGIKFDYLNYIRPFQVEPIMPKSFKTRADYMEGARCITRPGSGFISRMTDSGANNIFIRIDLSDGTHIVKNLIINRWRDNVSSLFNGKEVLDSSKDTMDILDASIGSYPNVFVIVKGKDFPKFLDLMKNMKGTIDEYHELQKFFISRSDKDFWKYYDWFQDYFYKIQPIEAGLYDLNRYAKTPWGNN